MSRTTKEQRAGALARMVDIVKHMEKRTRDYKNPVSGAQYAGYALQYEILNEAIADIDDAERERDSLRAQLAIAVECLDIIGNQICDDEATDVRAPWELALIAVAKIKGMP